MARNSFFKIPYGIRNGRIVHVGSLSEAERGLQCECVCPDCRSPLIARMGKIMRAHFAHAGEDSCSYGAETGIHLAAKQLIADRLEIPVPPLVARCEANDMLNKRHELTKPLFAGCDRQKVHQAKLEVGLGDVRPDLIVTFGQHQILIEVAVTHFIGDEKLRRLKARGLRCIEIDLQDLPRDATPEDIEAAVYDNGRAYWQVNPKLDENEAQLREELQDKIASINERIILDQEKRKADELARAKAEEAREEREYKRRKKAEQEDYYRRIRERKEADRKAEETRKEVEQIKQREWERKRRALDVAAMRKQAQSLLEALENRKSQAVDNSAPLPPLIRQLAYCTMQREGFVQLPPCIQHSTPHDWIFGARPVEWKTIIFALQLYAAEWGEKQQWRPARYINLDTLLTYDIQPCAELTEAVSLLAEADAFNVLQRCDVMQQIRALPSSNDAFHEFLAELASHGVIELRAERGPSFFFQVREPHTWFR